jgi:hypothetical protein
LNQKVERALKSTYTPLSLPPVVGFAAHVSVKLLEHVSYAREPLIVGVPWNAISNTFELFGLCYLTNLFEVGMGLTERTFLENQGCPMGLHFHRRDLHGKHRSSNGSPVFTQKDLYGKRRFAQWAFIFFWRGLLWKLEVVQLTLCFHTKDLPGK